MVCRTWLIEMKYHCQESCKLKQTNQKNPKQTIKLFQEGNQRVRQKILIVQSTVFKIRLKYKQKGKVVKEKHIGRLWNILKCLDKKTQSNEL